MLDVPIVGRAATLTCSFNLDVTMTEWLYNGGLVQLELHWFPDTAAVQPVRDTSITDNTLTKSLVHIVLNSRPLLSLLIVSLSSCIKYQQS